MKVLFNKVADLWKLIKSTFKNFSTIRLFKEGTFKETLPQRTLLSVKVIYTMYEDSET